MTHKVMGAILILLGCGGYGFALAKKYKTEEKHLEELLAVVQHMINELQYQLTPLPDLCRQCTKQTTGVLRDVFRNLSRELDWQMMPDAQSCMTAAIKRSQNLSKSLRRLLNQLGNTLGRFDLPGQVCGLQGVKANCEEVLKRYRNGEENRLRNYQTLSLCAGAALVILFI